MQARPAVMLISENMWENTAWRQMWKASKSTNDNKIDKCAE
jgi:hypothetical protein